MSATTTIFDPLDLMGRARARVGFQDPAYRAGLALVYKPIRVPVPAAELPDLAGTRVMLAGMEHVVGAAQIEAAAKLAGDNAARLADAVALLREGWRVAGGRWQAPVDVNAAAAVAGLVGAVVNAVSHKPNRKARRATRHAHR